MKGVVRGGLAGRSWLVGLCWLELVMADTFCISNLTLSYLCLLSFLIIFSILYIFLCYFSFFFSFSFSFLFGILHGLILCCGIWYRSILLLVFLLVLLLDCSLPFLPFCILKPEI